MTSNDTTLRPRRSAPSAATPSLALTIAAHPDPERVGERLLLRGLAGGGTVELSRHAPDFARPGRALGMPLGDPFVSRTPIHVSAAPGDRVRVACSGMAVAVDGVEQGAFVLGPLAAGDAVTITLAERIVLVLHRVDDDGDSAGDGLGMIGRSSGLARVRRAVTQVADLNVPVLIRGETGTGKELVARALHGSGPRRDRPFLGVNLGAVPRDLAAAELFGAVRGAYSGASRDRDGLMRAADGGTLFLDEVGEAPPEVQVMLLRVLETGELFPVGGHEPVAVDVRVIAATDADLDERIRDGRFRAPLLHRLAGHEIHVPPLRERVEDIGVLFLHFAREDLATIDELDRLTARHPEAEPWLPPAIATRLLRFRWPGNVRQLRNLTRQIVIASRGRDQLRLDPRLAAELDADQAASPARAPDAASAPTPDPDGTPDVTQPIAVRRRPSEVTEPEVVAALRAHAWDLKAAADQLGIPRSSIYDVIERCPSIRTAGDLTPDEIAASHREHGGDLDRMAAALEVSRRALQRRVRELGLAPGKG